MVLLLLAIFLPGRLQEQQYKNLIVALESEAKNALISPKTSGKWRRFLMGKRADSGYRQLSRFPARRPLGQI